MIRPYIIDELYTKHSCEITSRDNVMLDLLQSKKISHHSINITDEDAILSNLEKRSPLYRIPIKNINGIEELDNHIAIVLRNSIIFLSKPTNDIKVHIKFD